MQKSCLLGTIFSCYFTLDKLIHRLILVIILIFHVFKIMGTFCKFFKIKILLKYRFHLQCALSNLIIKGGRLQRHFIFCKNDNKSNYSN